MRQVAKFKNYTSKSTKKSKDLIEVEIDGVSYKVPYLDNAEALIKSVVKQPIRIYKDKCHGSMISGTAHIEFSKH